MITWLSGFALWQIVMAIVIAVVLIGFILVHAVRFYDYMEHGYWSGLRVAFFGYDRKAVYIWDLIRMVFIIPSLIIATFFLVMKASWIKCFPILRWVATIPIFPLKQEKK